MSTDTVIGGLAESSLKASARMTRGDVSPSRT